MNDLPDQWRDMDRSGLAARGVGAEEGRGTGPGSVNCAGRGSEKVLRSGSVRPRSTGVSRGRARVPHAQLHSRPVRGFVSYYLRSKETTLALTVGMQPT